MPRILSSQSRLSVQNWPDMRLRVGWQDGGDPGEAPAVEINGVRCLFVRTYCGLESLAADTKHSSTVIDSIGNWYIKKYLDEIETVLLETCVVERRAE